MIETSAELNAIANRNNFRLLVLLRLIAIIMYAAIFMTAYHILAIFIPIRPLMLELNIIIILQVFAIRRLKSKIAISNTENFIWLLTDTLFLILIMLQTGGPSNPFLFALIIPVILGSLLLDKKFAWAIYGFAIIGFLIIEFVESPFVVGKSRHSAFFEVQAQGMMLSFAISSLLLVFFVTKVMQNLKERNQALHEMREKEYEQQNLLRLGIMSAGAAHELGGPLATMSVILNDWKVLNPPRKKAERDEEIAILLQQLERGKNILTRILASSGQIRGQGAKHDSLPKFLREICDKWQAAEGHNVQLHYKIKISDIYAACDLILEQAITTILNNARDATIENKQNTISLLAQIIENNIVIKIEDFGKGIPENLIEKIKVENYSTKEETGFGVGLFLAHGTMQALGGTLKLENKADNNGAIAIMFFPLKAIAFDLK